MRPARDEDEFGRRGRIRDQAPPVIVDQHAAIEAFAELNTTARVGAAVGAAGDLDQAGAEADGVVAGDAARVAAAQAVGEIAGRAAPGGQGLDGRLREAAVVVGEIGGQVGLGRGHRGEPAEAELGDEAILEGVPESLDAALGLGRVGGDVADPEVPQDLAELGGMLPALQLFLETPVGVIADEDAEAIPVEGHGQAVLLGQPLQQREIAMQVLGGAEVEGEDGAGGVVDGERYAIVEEGMLQEAGARLTQGAESKVDGSRGKVVDLAR